MPAVMGKPSFENFSPKGKKGVSKEYGGGSGSGSESSSGPKEAEGVRGKKPGGKRSFFQKAKRFGKQGRHGKGVQVDAETYSYFVRILELLRKDEFDTDEDRDTLVENSLSMAEGNEVQWSSNQLVSRVVENVLPLASEDRIHSFCEAFTPSLRVVVADPFASHVLEKLLELTSSDKWRSSDKLTAWFEKASMFVLNNFEDFTFDTYGSFVTKKVLECLSGHIDHPKEQDILGTKGSKSRILQLELFGDRLRVDKWEKILQDFAKRFAAWPQFNDLGQRVETSRLLQNVIQTVSRTQNSEGVVKELVTRVLGTLPESLEPDEVAHRTLEVALSVADEKTYEVIFKKYYKGNLDQYIHGPCFTLQKLISQAPNEKIFTAIFKELAPEGIKKVVEEGRTAVIHSLATQCIKYDTKQEEFWKLIKDAYKSVEDTSGNVKANILMKIITLKPKTEKTDPQKFASTYFGASTVQVLMDFNASVAADIWKSFEGLKTPELMKMALDPKASFIISKMFKSWNVPQDQKEKLLSKLKDNLVELSTTKFGSRIIDLIWLWADVSQKTTVATILSQRIPLLSSNKYGRFHVETMGLQALVRNIKEWTEHIISQEKRQKAADKIATELGLGSGTVSTSPSSNEESNSSKKSKKRKSENKEPIAEPETVETETPKKKKKNRKSEVAHSEVSEMQEQPETTSEFDTPKKSKKKHRKSERVETEVKQEQEQYAEGHTETPKKKKKNRHSENVSIEDSSARIPEEDNETPKKKKNRKSQKGDDKIKNEPTEHEDTPKKKKKKNRESTN